MESFCAGGIEFGDSAVRAHGEAIVGAVDLTEVETFSVSDMSADVGEVVHRGGICCRARWPSEARQRRVRMAGPPSKSACRRRVESREVCGHGPDNVLAA